MPLRPLGPVEVLGIFGANVLALVLVHLRVADLVLGVGHRRVLDLALRLALRVGPLGTAAYELVLGPVTFLALSAAVQYFLARAPLARLECGTGVAATHFFSFRWGCAY